MEVQEGHPQLVRNQATVDRLVHAEAVEVAEDGGPPVVQAVMVMRIKPKAGTITVAEEEEADIMGVVEVRQVMQVRTIHPHPSTASYWQEAVKDTVQVVQGISSVEAVEDMELPRSHQKREVNPIREQEPHLISTAEERARTE